MVAACCFSQPLCAAGKDDLNKLRQRINSLQKEVESAEGDKADAADALKQSEQSISRINRSLRELSQQQADTHSALNQMQQQSRLLENKIHVQQNALGNLLYQNYLDGGQDSLKLLLNQQDPNQLARDLNYYAYISRARGVMIAALRQDVQQLHKTEQATREKSAQLVRLDQAQRAQQQALLREQNARKNVLARLTRQISTQRREIDRLQRDEKRLTRLVERLRKMAPAKPKQGARNSRQPDAAPAGNLAGQLKDKLRLPVAGELTNRFGSPRQDTGTPWKGLFIKAAAGREVKVIAPGRVVFSDWLRGFGNLIIVDHERGYMSLYGNNETLYKQAGETVKAGDVIAATGNSGGNAESGLYFELRYQSKPIDPLLWCKPN